MNLASVKGFLDRYLGGAGRSMGSIARILAVAAISFLLIGSLFPDRHRVYEDSNYNRVNGIATDGVARITSGGRSDLHGFQPRVDDDSFRIAWVGGSSIQSIGDDFYTFIPAEVARAMPTIDGGRQVTTDVYFLSGIRALDNYMAVLAAVDDEPDMIVVTINPAWVFNNTATRGWDELDPHAVQLLAADPRSATLFAPYLAPSDVVLGAASYASAPVRDRIRHSKAISDRLSGFTLLDRATPNEVDPPDELDQVRAMNIPVAFWRKYRLAPIPDQTLGERQAQILLESDLDARSINRAVLDDMARITANSGIPTYVYVAPVNHEFLEDPVVDEAVADIEAEIASHADRWSAANQRFVPTNLSRYIEPFAFADLIHIQEPDAVSNYLAPELCGFLAETGHTCDE